MKMTPQETLPTDWRSATLVGRAWRPDVEGPAVVTVKGGRLMDVTRHVATVSALFDKPNPAAWLASAPAGEDLGAVEDVVANSNHAVRDANKPWLIAPIDLQAVKAAGVTFVASLLERVIEEQARGDFARAEEIRGAVMATVGGDLMSIKPGSPQAMALKDKFVKEGRWSQYLEVGIGKDAEIFTKCQPMAAVGAGAKIGVHRESTWSNPEPEIVMVANGRGEIVGATLGNDVNLRDVEGRSALLLGRAKDNNGSTSLGPFVRLFDSGYAMADVEQATISLRVDGREGFTMEGASSMAKIGRSPADLVGQTIGTSHQYPDGVVLYLGTMFAPTKDRDAPGMGFTHKPGDRVSISTPKLGALINEVDYCDAIEPWTYGVGALMRYLARRGFLQ